MRALLFRRRMDEELQEELQFHLEMQARKNQRYESDTAEAERQARLQFGSVVRATEQCREQRGVSSIEVLAKDLRYAFRMLRKSPGFTAVAVLTLALGIGANTAIFSVINSVLLSNLPVKDPQQLVFLTNPDEQGLEIGFGDGDRDFLTYPEFRELERNKQVFSGVLAASNFTSSIPVELQAADSAANGAPARVSLVSGSYFSVLGVTPILGRAFGTEVDKLRDANPIAVISYAFWQGRFGGADNVIGRRIRILTTPYAVVGVAPPQFHGETVGANPDIWVPLTMQSEIFPGRDFLSLETKPFRKTEWLQAIGRLQPGATLVQAKTSIEVEFHQMMDSQTGGMSAGEKRQFLNQHLAVVPGSRGASRLRADFGKPLQILMAVVGLILVIACANVANILLARSAARQKEISVRVALGAGALRLFRQVLTESVLLAAFGGAVGLLLAHWADTALLRMVSSSSDQIRLDLHPDARVLAFTLGVSLLTGILFGLAPAFRATRVDLNSVLKGTSRRVAGGAVHSGRVPSGKILVIAQVALSLLLLVVAGLFVRSFRNLCATQLGYDRDHLLEFWVNPLAYGYQSAAILALDENILQNIAAIPGVRGATLADNGLLSDTDSNSPVTIEGQKPLSGDEAHARWDMVGPNFFSTTGIPILAGREITEQDSGNGQRVGVINETMARKFFSNSNPIGQRAFVHTTAGQAPFVVVGVAQDSKRHSAREKALPRFYIPYFNPITDDWTAGAAILIRTAGEPSSFSSAIRNVVKQAAANLAPVTMETMDQRFADSLVTDRMIAELCGAFGVLAVLLVCIGLYGIMAYATSGRTNEIGIRITLGAQRSGILWLILRESLLLVLIGAAIGVPLVCAAGKWISSLLFGLQPADALTLASAIALMFVVGVFASYIPARRAMRVDPMVALRYE
ncbi:MAG TPA: ABC transporter permease [Terriglobales bacterium]|nr:ABC transporter permease [Terriglobales bacterium]